MVVALLDALDAVRATVNMVIHVRYNLVNVSIYKTRLHNPDNNGRAQAASLAALAHPPERALALDVGDGEVLLGSEGRALPSPRLGEGEAVWRGRKAYHGGTERAGACDAKVCLCVSCISYASGEWMFTLVTSRGSKYGFSRASSLPESGSELWRLTGEPTTGGETENVRYIVVAEPGICWKPELLGVLFGAMIGDESCVCELERGGMGDPEALGAVEAGGNGSLVDYAVSKVVSEGR